MRLEPTSLSPARLAANRANARLSTGPKSPEGRATVSQNRWRHGLTGEFMTLAWEREEDFQQLVADLHSEHQPSTPTEKLLVDRMAQHHWLAQRALSLQSLSFNTALPMCREEGQLALYLRYQTTHERAFHKCLRELATLRAERRTAAVGFESQKRLAAAEQRKNFDESRKQELHTARLNLIAAQIAAKTPRQPVSTPSKSPDIQLKTAA